MSFFIELVVILQVSMNSFIDITNISTWMNLNIYLLFLSS